jgi:phosphoribosylanthranilate isomerase
MNPLERNTRRQQPASDQAAAPAPQRPAHRTRIKICGLSQPQDVAHAVALGVDAIGLVFYPPSPRAVTASQAGALVREIPPFVCVAGLFVNPDDDWFGEVLDGVRLTLLQIHGDESPARCDALAERARLPWLRAVRVGSLATRADLVESALRFARADGLLIDTLVDGYGGGGKVFDWSLIPEDLGPRVVLSGGLNAQNVPEAIRRVRPYAVDVSSGVEMAGAKGVKDHARMTAFVRAVRAADEAIDQ